MADEFLKFVVGAMNNWEVQEGANPIRRESALQLFKTELNLRFEKNVLLTQRKSMAFSPQYKYLCSPLVALPQMFIKLSEHKRYCV